MRLNGTTIKTELKLDEKQGVNPWVQVLRTGKFQHPTYGLFEITSKILAEMKSNFDKKIRGIDISFDYFHKSDEEASGWPTELELREGNSELWAKTDWTPVAAKKLADRELRYFSPDFAFKWTDPESGATFDNVLFGGALTNRPFVKEMNAIVASEESKKNSYQKQGEFKMDEKDKMIAELQAKIAELEAKVKGANPEAEGEMQKMMADKMAMKAENEKMLSELSSLKEEKAKSDAAKVLAEKETSFNILLTEGKACAAQKDAFVKGDMSEFIKLAQPLNLKGTGVVTANESGADADVEAIIKLAEAKEKANPKLSRSESISQAKKELKK